MLYQCLRASRIAHHQRPPGAPRDGLVTEFDRSRGEARRHTAQMGERRAPGGAIEDRYGR